MINSKGKIVFVLLLITITGITAYSFKSVKSMAPPRKDIRPNIIIILADDLGYSDIGCFGGEVHTPNLDYLAANGLRFSRFYNISRCCPSRASLLTGIYNHDAGIGEMTTDKHVDGYRGHITENAVTLAEVLKGAGYHTAMSGKWHVSNTVEQATKEAQLDWLDHKTWHPLFSPIEQYPTSRGFERFFGTLWGVVDYYDPFSLVSNTTPIKNVPANYYHTDAINDTAAAYIRDYSKSDKPFFLYVAQNAPHWPIQAPANEIEKYKDTYKAGWDAIREARYKRMLKMGIIPANAKLSPRFQNGLKWENNPDREWDARAMAVHAAMIDRMDQGIGRIIKALKETGQLENTLIFFLSDNGASPEVCANFGPGFDRPGETRTGQKINYIVKKDIMPGPQTSYASIGPRWANVANTPYQFAKADSYEGGVHAPLIAFWPKGITAKKGGISKQLGHVMDFMSTAVELAKANYPSVYNGHKILPMQGISLVPALKNKVVPGHSELFNEHIKARYARMGDWKLVSHAKDTTWHLYNLKDDATEINDLSAKYPEKVRELTIRWRQWAFAHHVLPKPAAGRKPGE